MLLISLKYLGILECAFLFSFKIKEHENIKKYIFFYLFFSTFFSVFLWWLRQQLPFLSILFIVFLVFINNRFFLKNKIDTSLFLAIISTTVGFLLEYFAQFTLSPIVFILILNIGYRDNMHLVDITSSLGIFVVNLLFLFLLLKNKRLILGFQKLVFNKNLDIFVHISIGILFLLALLSPNGKTLIYIIPILCAIFLGITLYLLFRNKITNMYIDRLKTREITNLKLQIENLVLDNNTLAKQIHKDNKIIPILQVALCELSKSCNKTPHIADLQSQLDVLIKERYHLTFKESNTTVTYSIPSTSAVLNYYHSKSKTENIHLDLNISKEAFYKVPISINNLNTILCDLLENAIIAVRTKQNKKIYLEIALEKNTFLINIFDTGSAFSKEVLNKMGQEQITTYSQTGGSGIGLMTIFEIVRMVNGIFRVESFDDKTEYSKGIFISLPIIVR